MAAFNGFPATYQQMYPYPFPQQMMQQQMQQPAGRTVEAVPVDSEEVAVGFPVPVGSTVELVAKDDSFVAFKSNNVNGQSSLVFYDRRPPAPPVPAFDPAAYIRRDELKDAVEAILGANRGGADA